MKSFLIYSEYEIDDKKYSYAIIDSAPSIILLYES